VDPSAAVCPTCKVELGVCAWCRAVTTLRNVQPSVGWIPTSTRYACDRCGRLGARCRTSMMGSYCNALARADIRFGLQVCPVCRKAVMDRTISALTLVGLAGGLLKRK
jgi:hypothetical protein